MVSIPLIEEVLKMNSKDILNDRKQILGLAKQLDWSERQVERWIRRRNKQDRPPGFFLFTKYKLKIELTYLLITGPTRFDYNRLNIDF